MRGKGRVITASVLRVQNQRKIKNFSLKRRILAVKPQHMQNILRGRKLPDGLMYKKTVVIVKIVIICLIAVYRKHRKERDKLDTLTQNHSGIEVSSGLLSYAYSVKTLRASPFIISELGAFIIISLTNEFGSDL